MTITLKTKHLKNNAVSNISHAVAVYPPIKKSHYITPYTSRRVYTMHARVL